MSKKEAANALKQVKEVEDSNCNDQESQTKQQQTASKTASTASPSQNNKSFERKNSFLSKLFSSGSSSNSSSQNSQNSSPKKLSNGNVSKPVLATFSAQFPPPEMVTQPGPLHHPSPQHQQQALHHPSPQHQQQALHPPPPHQLWTQQQQPFQPDPNAIYQTLIPASQRPQPSSIHSDSSNSSPCPQVASNSNGHHQPRINYSPYGYAMIQPRSPEGHRPPKSLNNSFYSAPPPPLPYRPPPPNPYNTRPSPRPSPTNMRLTPSPASNGPPSNHSNTPPTYARVSNLKKVNNNIQQNGTQSPTVRNVRFADEHSTSNLTSASSTASNNSSSGPSSIESQKNNVYDETLLVIEKSNKELEKKLSNTDMVNKMQPPLIRPRIIDTIHNGKNSLAQEIIYEVEPNGSNNGPENAENNALPRSNSQTQLKNNNNEGTEVSSSIAASYPSLSDLSIAEITCGSFKSITAQKLMAGLSFNSIDTLLEVNAAAEARSKLNESTETVDFGII